MNSIRPLAVLAATNLASIAAAAVTALASSNAEAGSPPSDFSAWGSYVQAGWGDAGGAYAPNAVTREANGQYAAYAAASLVDGKLHASVTTPYDPELPSYCTVLTCSWGTSATAEVWEIVTIKPGAGREPGQVVPWSLSMDGIKKRGFWAWGDGAYAHAYYYFGADPYGWSRPHDLSLGAQNGVGGSYMMPTDGSPITLYYYAKLTVSAYSGSVSDYSNTMAFHWTLPEGATFTSASGLFMTAAVPEPSSGALLLAGAGALGWVVRRRRAAVA